MKYLIVAADDFGFAESVNEGIVKAFGEGIVTHINLMPAGEALDDALRRAGSIKLKEAGAHLALTGATPVSDPATIPTLVTKDGKFYKNYAQFFPNLFLKKIDPDHIHRELKAQLDIAVSSRIKITDINSHEHIHMMPGILEIFINLAKEYGIPSIRYPHKESISAPIGLKKMYKKAILSYFEKTMRAPLERSGLIYPESFLGFLDAGNLRENIIINMLRSLGEGVTELVCHPGFVSPELLEKCIFYLDCESELAALTSRNVKNFVNEKGIKLITYGEFIEGRCI